MIESTVFPHLQAPPITPLPDHADAQMHEEASPDKNASLPNTNGKALNEAAAPVKEIDADDDMDEDEEVCDCLAFSGNAASLSCRHGTQPVSLQLCTS